MTNPTRVRSMYVAFVLSLVWLSCSLAAGTEPVTPATSIPRPDEAAWTQLQKETAAFEAMRPKTVTGGGMEAFYKEYFPKAGKLADRLEAFLKAYPDSPHAEEAWHGWMELLNLTAARLPERKTQLERVERELLADPKLSRDRRRTIYTSQLDRTTTVAECKRLFGSVEGEYKTKHDTYNVFYVQKLLTFAQQSEPREAVELAGELLKLTDGWSGGVRDDVITLRATLDRIGKPLDLKFTAFDGRAIDLKDYRGKVVLLNFWATWCPPCVAGLPKVDKIAAELRDQGFEVIGLTYDTDRTTLEKFLKSNGLKWPQFFDAQGQDAPLMKSLGSPSPPTYWLIGRDGLLADVSARKDLNLKVKALLASTAATGSATGR